MIPNNDLPHTRLLLTQALRLGATNISQGGLIEPDRAWLIEKLNSLESRNQQLHERIVDEALAEVSDRAGVIDWLGQRLFLVKKGLPRMDLPVESASLFMRQIDLDSLVCLHPDLQMDIRGSHDWNTFVHTTATEGLNTGPTPSVESHIHLGGALGPSYYWIRLLSGGLSLRGVNDRNFLGKLTNNSKDKGISQFDVAGSLGWCMAARLWLCQHLARGSCAECRSETQTDPLPELYRVFQQVLNKVDSRFANTLSTDASDTLTRAVLRGYFNFGPADLHRTTTLIDRLRRYNGQNQLLRPLSSEQHFSAVADPLHRLLGGSQTRVPHYAAGERRLLIEVSKSWHSGSENMCPKMRQVLMDYLSLKNAFHRRLANNQDYDGLLGFTRNFDRRRIASLGGRRGLVARSTSSAAETRFPQAQSNRLRLSRAHFERDRLCAALIDQLYCAFESDSVQRRLEMRVSLPDNHTALGTTVEAWVKGYDDYLKFVARTGPRKGSDKIIEKPNHFLGLVVHSIKYEDRKRSRQRANADCRCLLHWLSDGRRDSGRELLRRFFLGYDAAGNERFCSPRDFFPAFADLRKKLNSSRYDRDAPIHLGLTFHVGEDVNDFITGLRHIDETLELLLGGGPGRLGHALVLGHCPRTFYQRRGPSLISRRELLLNLVWAWQFLGYSAPYSITDYLRGQIMQMLSQLVELLPGKPKRRQLLTSYLDLAWKHWQPHNTHNRSQTHNSNLILDDDELVNELLLGFGLIDNQSHNTAYNEILNERVPVQPSSELAWDAQKLLQDDLKAKISGRQVCIEANPTSNFLVGGYERYAELPYKNWVKDGLCVSINTDDPGLFMTTLPQEFSALYTSHFEQSSTHQEKIRWLNERRLDAEEHSFFTAESLNRQGRDKMLKTYLRSNHTRMDDDWR